MLDGSYNSTLLIGSGWLESSPPAISTLPLFNSVAVASLRAWFIEGFEAAGAKLPPDVEVACAEGPDVGVECAEGEDESPPHPASARTTLKTTPRKVRLLVICFQKPVKTSEFDREESRSAGFAP